MLIRKLIIENFGLFRGRNEIELTPKIRNGRTRPVVLVGGKNGAGKTTLLEAVRLCLYGPLAIGKRVNNRDYEQYLRHRVHRDEAALIQLDYATVGMQFEYAEHGHSHVYEIERTWQLQHAGHVETQLTVLRDGEPLDELDQEHTEDFLRDMIPPGVSQLYFFDGEKIQELAETEDDDLALAEAIRGLLGLDLVERLHGDLRIYSSRVEDSPSAEPVEKEISELETRRSELNEERVAAMRRFDDSHSRVDRLRKHLARSESKLAKEGGAFANKRDALKAEKKQLLETIKELEDQIRHSCEDLLPFTLAAQRCRQLRDQLKAEATLQAWQSHEQHLTAKIDGLRSTLDEQLFPSHSRIGKATREELTARVLEMLDRLSAAPDDIPQVEMIHRLSEEQRSRLISAVDRVLDQVPQQLESVQKLLEKATRRLSKVEQSLKKVPDDDQLQPLLERMRELHSELAAGGAEAERSEAAVKQIDFRLTELDREERKLRVKLADAEKGLDRRAMVARVRNALDDYAQALTTTKSKELSEAVAGRFAQLWRKGDVVRRIEIDPVTFKVTLHDRHDREVPKHQLSAGEKQIYAISMLWGLAEVSGRPLPMVIDTPLGRLDGDHRAHLVERYFPHASHQVIILSTDTEIDKTYFQDLAPSISHSYRLQYDTQDARTRVEKGYFWKREKELVHAD